MLVTILCDIKGGKLCIIVFFLVKGVNPPAFWGKALKKNHVTIGTV